MYKLPFVVAVLSVLASGRVFGWKCSTCKDIVKKFNEGIEKTAKSGFGGGNTRWEEKSLGTYAFSETRFIEILENSCSDGSKECHMLLEKHEEDMEDWWFKHYAKKKDTDLHKYLCIDKAMACCAEGAWGPVCLSCRGGQEQPCRGNGRCDGSGTREGTGKCSCNSGYKGEQCEECAEDYFRSLKNETHTICTACHESCKDGCESADRKDCYDCKDGWDLQEEGCFDINECDAEKSPCESNQFCTNTDGSHTCTNCHKSCAMCTGASPDKCMACAPRYYKDEKDGKCKGCHMSCAGSCIDSTSASCDACKEGWTQGDSGCEDINECETEAADDCEDDSYCSNSPGSYKCSTCHAYCNGCTGAGSNKCKQCKDGYKKDEQEFCKDIDECTELNYCSGETEKCINLPGSYRCECVDGHIRKDDQCVEKPKDKPKEKKPKSKAYRGPGTCKTCKDIVRNINKGMAKTEGNNFGGGNTQWEEAKLGKYMYSETRLIEIMEPICTKKDEKDRTEDCYDMLEKYEETLEDWWFNKYAKGEKVEMETWLCVEKMMICCHNGTYGPSCKNCIGGRERPCTGNGECDGDGSRLGSGVCNCSKGYQGYYCNECAPLNYTAHHNDTDIECKGCHEACMTACFDDGPMGCEDCNTGWKFETEKGCVDVNECEREDKPCDADQYCQNTEGAFVCNDCDEACEQNCVGPGPGNCLSCGELYYKDQYGQCKACHKACSDSCTDDSTKSCNGCKSGWMEDEEEGCIDLNECNNGEANCKGNEYCENTDGSFKCNRCHTSCTTCTGPGNDQCDGCADGYRADANNACQDVDECSEPLEGGPICEGEGRMCVNTVPGYKCKCMEGLEEDKLKNCVPKKEKPSKKKKPAKEKKLKKAKKTKKEKKPAKEKKPEKEEKPARKEKPAKEEKPTEAKKQTTPKKPRQQKVPVTINTGSESRIVDGKYTLKKVEL